MSASGSSSSCLTALLPLPLSRRADAALLGAAAAGRRSFSKADLEAHLKGLELDGAKPMCAWCGQLIDNPRRHAEMDHLHPHSQGGATDLSNLGLLHAECNRQKGARPLAEGPFMRQQAARLNAHFKG